MTDARPAKATTYEATASSRAFRGGLWQSIGQVSPYVYTVIVSIVAARILGPERMGRQSFIAFTATAVQTVCTTGLGTALLRFIGELRGRGLAGRLRPLYGLAWRVSLLSGAIGGAALLVVAGAGAQPTWAWLFAGAAVVAGVLHRVPGTFLIGLQRWRLHAMVLLVTGAASVAATIAVLILGGGVSGMLGVIAGTAAAMLVWTTVLARRLLNDPTVREESLGELRSNVLKFAAASTVPVIFSLVVFQRSELFFLERFSSDTQIALYSIAFSATATLVAVPTAIGSIVTPSVAGLVGTGEFDRVRRGYSRVLRLSLLFALPLAAAGLALGPQLLRLVYGERYAGVGDIFMIVVLTLPLTPLSGASSAVVMGYGRVRLPIVVSGMAAAVDVALAAVLVPRLDATGAAIANTCAFTVAALLLIVYAARLVGGVHLGWRPIARIAMVSVVAAALARVVLLAGESVEVFAAAAAVEVAVLLAAATFFRVVPEDDATFLIRVAGGGRRIALVLGRLSDRSRRLPA
jgi:O-antigen/teichoic acid export membrane protein